MNRIWLLGIIMIFLGCNHSPEKYNLNGFKKNIKFKDKNISNEAVFDTLKNLCFNNQSDKALKLIDSIISYNQTDGLLYYDRGGVNMAANNYKAAILDYRKAEALNFDKDKCEKYTQRCQDLLDGKH